MVVNATSVTVELPLDLAANWLLAVGSVRGPRDLRHWRQTVGAEGSVPAGEPLVFRTASSVRLRWREDHVTALGAHVHAVAACGVSLPLGVAEKEVCAARRRPARPRCHVLPVGQRRVAIFSAADVEVDNTEARR